MGDDLPFRAEYAKSGRAGCKMCKNNIGKDELRLAVMVQSPVFDGKMPNWFHFKCFFARQKVKTVADIANFNSLRWEDQEKIKESIAGGNNGPAKSKNPTALSDLDDFSTEYAKSSRSTCRSCEQKIDKGIVRISKLDYESQKSKMYGPQPGWYHVDCFIKNREELEYFDAADKLPGFFTLGVDDQKELKSKLKKSEGKRKATSDSAVPSKKQKIELKDNIKLKKQNDLVFKYRDWLQKNLSKKDYQELLEFNEQDIPKGESDILDLLSDCLAFGALERCTECKDGQLRFRTDGYHCGGHLSVWTKCNFVTKTPKRKPFIIPEDFKEHSFLKKYKSAVSKRLFPTNEEAPSQPSSSNSDSGKKKETDKVLPLDNLKIAIAGKLSKSPKEFAKVIEQLGGSVVSAVDENVACVISNEEEVQKNSKKIKSAKKSNVHVVSEKFLEDVKNGGAAIMIAQHNLCTWGGDPTFKINAFMANKVKQSKSTSDEKYFTKSLPDKVKMTVKGAAAVDPESELEDVAHVLEERGTVYNAVLGMVDVTKGTNSYYKLQILEHDRKHSYWVFRSWGRVGTTIGGSKCDARDKQDAIKEFKRLYEEKTGNCWEDRKNFVKHPNRFYPLDIDYGQDSEPEKLKKLQPGSKSKLRKEVQELICLIFDIESMKKAMVQFEIDLKKMPLGKLSKQQIQHAYSVLTEAQELIQKGESQFKILDVSNRFYTLIPHDFGMKKPPMLDNEEIIKNKMEMLESLLEIEVAYSLLKETKDNKDVDPVDQHYHQLKTDINVLENSSEEYDNIAKYLTNTHGETHRQYELKLQEAFKISRQGEAKRYKPFKKLHNRFLLWHGSRLTNFAGILSQGLRIAPPEAPSTGYMFGKGIYFADMVSKSANYCYPSKDNPYGLLLLCEVALGNMYERKNADYITKLPPNMHSTKGLGSTMPDPKQTVTLPDGSAIPLGKPVPSNIKGNSLLYNEYIIYDTAQVSIKYLLKVKFDWKY